MSTRRQITKALDLALSNALALSDEAARRHRLARQAVDRAQLAEDRADEADQIVRQLNLALKNLED